MKALFKSPDHRDCFSHYAWDAFWRDFWSTRNTFGKVVCFTLFSPVTIPLLALLCVLQINRLTYRSDIDHAKL